MQLCKYFALWLDIVEVGLTAATLSGWDSFVIKIDFISQRRSIVLFCPTKWQLSNLSVVWPDLLLCGYIPCVITSWQSCRLFLILRIQQQQIGLNVTRIGCCCSFFFFKIWATIYLRYPLLQMTPFQLIFI